MSSGDLDHNFFALGHRRRPSELSDQGLPFHDIANRAHSPRSSSPIPDESATILPSSTYTRFPYNPPKQLSISTSFGAQQAAKLRDQVDGPTHLDETSPDPHDFYRQYHDPFANASGGPIGQESLLVSPVEGMTTSSYRRKSSLQSVQSVRSNGASSNTSAPSRVTTRPSYRSSSFTSNNDASLTSAKSNPTLSSSSRSRQSSLKDLVNKFDQIADEVPPVPSNPGSRAASRAVSPASSRGVYSRSRTASVSKPPGPSTTSNAQQPHSAKTPTSTQRKRPNESFESLVSSSHHPRNQKHQLAVGSNTFASQSLTNLNPTVPTPRKPLFGEILSLTTASTDLGYGIPTQTRRRGSEGSMHSPNPMFSDGRADLSPAQSPSSPTAWYLGYAPSLESVSNIRQPTRSELGAHRRTRSDLAGLPLRPAHASMLGTHMATMSPPPELASGGSSGSTSKRGSGSRIPVSTRRHSDASNSGNSSASTRANSAMSRDTTAKTISSKVTSALPKPSSKSFGAGRTPQISLTPKSPRMRGLAAPVTPSSKSPLLKANIIAPLPKKSPPLRSSRPRQPVSTASTSASRARVTEKVNSSQSRTLQGPDMRSTKQRAPARLPGLENLDFAARRQKIRQAIEQTNEENARKEALGAERRRVVKEREEKVKVKEKEEKAKRDSESREKSDTKHINSYAIDSETTTPIIEAEGDYETFETPAEEFTEEGKALTIDTSGAATPSAQNGFSEISRFSVDDSPILGNSPDDSQEPLGRPSSASPASDPVSAVTAETVETDGTRFDNEPQIEHSSPADQQHTILSQVMQMRDTSPASVTYSDEAEETSYSERDDQESIQIMLRDTAYFDNGLLGGLNVGEDTLPGEVFASSGPRDRSSLSSWTSSVHDRQSIEGAMERIGEDSPPQPQQGSHLSSSTAANDRTPQAWSPATVTPQDPQQLTPQEDAYSTVNRMHERYPDPSFLSPEMMQDFQRQIFEQSPGLARQGKWDPKKVTQMYLQELAKGRSAKSTALRPPPLNLRPREDASDTTRSPSEGQTPTAEDLDNQPTGDKGATGEAKPSLAPSPFLNRLQQRASLNQREDWESASPSIVDWMTFAAANQSPVEPSEEEAGPTPPPKDAVEKIRDDDFGTAEIHGSGTPVHKSEGIAQRLGLAIRVQSPGSDSPAPIAIPTPPAPEYAPPLPPMFGRTASPSVYGSQPPSSIFSSGPIPPVPPIPSTRTSEDSTKIGSGPSAQGSGSSFNTLGRGSLDQMGTEASASVSSPTPEQRQLKKRGNVVAELLDTENSYGRDMKVVEDIYKGTCSSCPDLTKDDVRILFGNSDEIVQFSMLFLDSLKQAARSIYVIPKSKRYHNKRGSRATTSTTTTTDEQSSVQGSELSDTEKDRETFIGMAFREHLGQMEKIYSDYLKNHDAANKRISTLKQNPNVGIWLQECQQWAADLTNAWDLDSLLIKPVQRLTRYPLLLRELTEATPKDHPDFDALEHASREIIEINARINEAKKRTELVEQVIGGRKRKDSDARVLQKVVGRRTEKFKQQPGSSETYEDKAVNKLIEDAGTHTANIVVIMRDVEGYLTAVQGLMDWWNEFMVAVDECLDVAHSTSPEKESRWRKCRLTVKEITMIALPEHLAATRKSVTEPMMTLTRLYENPKRVIEKRNKRFADHVRFRFLTAKGDKPDKRTIEQSEKYEGLNMALRDELPRLFSLTGKAMRGCLHNFVAIRMAWLNVWQRKMMFAIEGLPNNFSEIFKEFKDDFSFTEGQVLSLSITNGSLLQDISNMANFLTPATTYSGESALSPRRPPTFGSSNNRSVSLNSDGSIVFPADYKRNSGSFTHSPLGEGLSLSNMSLPSSGRMRASSNVSGRGPGTPDTSLSSRTMSGTTPVSLGNRPSTSGGHSIDPLPQLPRLSIETPSFNLGTESSTMRPFSADDYFNGPEGAHPSPSPANRYSDFFSSAMPMSDSPIAQTPVSTETPGKKIKVLFLAASVYEFNIDRSRREAGYPYLTYVAGEIFDVIGEKGELWLARNQDDSTRSIGWIWNKHFAKLAS